MRIAACVIVGLAAFGAASSAQATTVTIGTEGDYPPFSETDPAGKLGGFDVDIANALCKQAKLDCTIVRIDRGRQEAALRSGTIDAIVSSMWITPERKREFAFTAPYYDMPTAIAVAKDSALDSASDIALSDKTLGTQADTIDAAYAKAHFPDAGLKLFPSTDAYQQALSKGGIDAAIDDAGILSQWLSTDSGACCKLLDTLPIDPAINGSGAGIALRKDEAALRDALDKALAAIRKNGTYAQIAGRYFDFDISGGGGEK